MSSSIGRGKVAATGGARTALSMIARNELRARTGSVVLLAVVTAVVVAVVLGGAAGARRTLSATDRFVEQTRARDLLAFVSSEDILERPEEIDRAAAAVAAVDGVEEVHVQRGFLAMTETSSDFVVMTSPEGSVFRDIDRPVLLEGRMPGDDRADEVLLNETAADLLGVGVGDRLRVPTATPEYMGRLVRGQVYDAEIELNGPRLDLEVVGVGRQGEDIVGDANALPAALASPAFDRRYLGEVASTVAVLPLVTDGTVEAQAVVDALASLGFRDEVFATTIEDDWLGTARSTNRVVGISTLVVVLVAAVAGAVVLAQMIGRQAAVSAHLAAVARPLGLTRRERRLLVSAPGAVGVAVGSLAGVGLAIGLSPLFPLSRARLAEPAPGVAVDLAVSGVGLVAVLVIGLGWTWVAARSATEPLEARPARRSAVGSAATALLRPPAALGVRMATRRATARGVVPVRSALVGATVGVAGVVGIGVVMASIAVAVDSPERFGWTWSSRPDLFAEDPYATAAQIAAEDGIAAAGEEACALLPIDGTTTYACAIRSMAGSTPPVITEGRAPSGPGEVALNSRAMERGDVDIGDTVTGRTAGGDDVELEVVGRTVLYGQDSQAGALLDMAGIEALWPASLAPDDGRALLLTYEEGVDADALEAQLAEDYEVDFPSAAKSAPPGRLAQMDRMGALFVTLASFLAGLGVVGLVQFLALSVRRRRSQFGVLRALGFRRRDVRRAVTWQAVVAAGVGVVVGLPLGVAAGRTVWHLAVAGLDIVDQPATPWFLVLAVVVVAPAGAAVVAQAPGWYAARARPAEALRAE